MRVGPRAGTTFVSAGGGGWSCSGTATVTCTLATLAKNTTATFTIVVTAPSTAQTLTNGATSPEPVTVDFSQMTQLASTPSELSSNTDGASAGSLTSFTVGQAGDITGLYSNGFKQPLGQIALASFSNPSGLSKSGGNLFMSVI